MAPSQEPPSQKSPEGAMSVEELLATVLNNTLAVFTTAPDRRKDWLETLAKWRAQASRQGHLGFARFVSAVQQLVAEGAPEPQEVELEEPYASAWQALLSVVNHRVTSSSSVEPPGTSATPKQEQGQAPRTVEELLAALIEETLTVITVAPDMREEWWTHLAQIQAQLEEGGDPESARFVTALRQLGQESPQRLLEIDLDQDFVSLREALATLVDVSAAPEAEHEQEMTAEQLLSVVAHNTRVALAGPPERREAWSATLERLGYQAMDLGDYDFAAFLLATRRLLEGDDPETLEPDLPEPYATSWKNLVTQTGIQADEAAAEGPGNLEQILDLIVQTTVHVMHAAPRERETWWNALGDYRSQALEHDDGAFADFLGGVRRVVEGSDAPKLDLELEGPYAAAWDQLTVQLELARPD
jgi:hypothetical protein